MRYDCASLLRFPVHRQIRCHHAAFAMKARPNSRSNLVS